jgi:hypothetical protein
MATHNNHTTISYGDRLGFALEAVAILSEQGHGFISDDNLLDIAACWTIDRYDTRVGDYPQGDEDYSHLVDDLFRMVLDF